MKYLLTEGDSMQKSILHSGDARTIQQLTADHNIKAVRKIFKDYADDIYAQNEHNERVAQLSQLCTDFQEQANLPKKTTERWFKAEISRYYNLDS